MEVARRTPGPASANLQGRKPRDGARGWRGVGLLDTTTGRDRELLRDDRYPIVEARFSPDDKWIAYSTSSGRKSQSWVVAAAGGKAVRLGAGAFPAWAPSGTMLSLDFSSGRAAAGVRCRMGLII